MLQIAVLVCLGAHNVHGLGLPNYANGFQFDPLSGDLKIGFATKVTRYVGCGAVEMVTAARAIYDVNTRNSTYCPAIAKLGPASMFNVSIGFLDNAGNPKLAINSALYFANLKPINGQLHGGAVHGVIGMGTSGTSQPTTKLLAALQYPQMCFASLSPVLSSRSDGNLVYPNFFRVLPSDQGRVDAAARVIKSLGYTSAVSLYFSALYTSSMCDGFRSAAVSREITVTSKELPSTGGTGFPPGAAETARIGIVLKELRDDPMMPRVIMLCGYLNEVVVTMNQAAALGMRTKQSGYLWLTPDDHPIDADSMPGIFTLVFQVQSPRSDVYRKDFDSGLIPTEQNFEYMFSQPICGDDQSTVCWDEPQTSADPKLNYFLYNDTARTSFNMCRIYAQFAYDAVVMYAIAMHKGIATGMFSKDTVTPKLLQSALKTLAGDFSYGECLAAGQLAFNADQDRPLPYLLYNVIKSGGTNKLLEVAVVPAMESQNIIWSNGNLIQCSVDSATPCATATAPILMTAAEKLSTGVAANAMPRGSAPACASGNYFHNGACTLAPAGYYAPLAASGAWIMTPTKCAPGMFTATPGQSSCTSASIGTAANANQTGESPCLVGEYSSETQAATCSKCSPGDFQDQPGQSSCKRCPIGRYSKALAQSSCTACPAGKTTKLPGSSAFSDCICPKGEYLDHASYACKKCPTGIECPFGSTTAVALGSGATALRVKEGYYVKPNPANVADAVVNGVYSCDVLGESVLGRDGYFSPCPGGGAGSCTSGRDNTAIACGMCQNNYFRNSAGGCEECDGYEAVLLVVALVLGMWLPVGAYFFINSPVTARLSELGLAVMSFGSLITNLQLTAVVAGLSVSWTDGLRTLFQAFEIFGLDLKFVRGDCLMRGDGFNTTVCQLLMPCIFGCVLFGVYALSRRIYPEENKLHMKFPETFNTFFTVYQAVFIAFILAIVRPLRCYVHPNGESSMVDHPNVLCWDSNHAPLVIICAFAFFVEIVLFIAYYARGILILPKKSATDPGLVRRLKFIVYRFRGGAWYWGIVFLLRNTLTGIAIMLDPSQPYAQMMLPSIVLVIYLGFLVRVWPWKSTLLNLADAIGCGALVCMLISSCPAVATMSDSLADQVTYSALIFWTIGIGVQVAFVCYGVACWYQKRRGGEAYKEAKLKERLGDVHSVTKALNNVCGEVVKLPIKDLNVALSDVSETDLFRLQQVLVFLQLEFLDYDALTASHNMGLSSTSEGGISRRISGAIASTRLSRVKTMAHQSP